MHRPSRPGCRRGITPRLITSTTGWTPIPRRSTARNRGPAASLTDTDQILLKGRLAVVLDRGAKTVTRYDGRGRTTGLARRLVLPGTPSDTLGSRYTPHWYTQSVTFDAADRPVNETTGVDPDLTDLLDQNGHGSYVATTYSKRNVLSSVGTGYGPPALCPPSAPCPLVRRIMRDADGLITQTVYGDRAPGTTSAFSYDGRRRLSSVQTYRGAPAIWSPPSPISPQPDGTTQQLLLEDVDYHYDEVDNPTEIDDFRNPAEWPSGAQPVTRKIQYDDLYRVTNVEYQYPGGVDGWVSPFDAEDQNKNPDPRRATPAPRVKFASRVLSQSFQYDWLGNTKNTDDDAHGFYDCSLGTISNGIAMAGPYRVQAANAGGPNGGSLSNVFYDAAGDLTDMKVARSGHCLGGASCSQQFHYDWDEVGRLVHAQRFDGGTNSPSAELFYAYDASDDRTLKTAIDMSGGSPVYDAYIFDSLELRGATTEETGATEDYVRSDATEVAYLFAHGVRLARVHYALASEPTLSSGRQHVLLELPDHLGSTSIVLDRDTSELVERGTYMAYGQADSDYRPARWNAFREDHRFTGKEEDVEVGLQYFGKRYLSAALGRWASADPLAVHGLAADFTVYAYVHGSLLKAVDPTGLGDTGMSSTCATNTCTGPGEDQSTKVSRAVPKAAAASTGNNADEAPPDCLGCSRGAAMAAAFVKSGFGGVLNYLHDEANTRPDAGTGEKELPPGGVPGTPDTIRARTALRPNSATSHRVGPRRGGCGGRWQGTRRSAGAYLFRFEEPSASRRKLAPPGEGAASLGAETSTAGAGRAPQAAVLGRCVGTSIRHRLSIPLGSSHGLVSVLAP